MKPPTIRAEPLRPVGEEEEEEDEEPRRPVGEEEEGEDEEPRRPVEEVGSFARPRRLVGEETF